MVEWVGHTLGRYHLEGVIGQGAMGVVLRAYDPELERTVAVKILYPHLATDRDLVERFRREARTAANLRHRSIVSILDVGQESNFYYLVMEYLDGQPLSKVIEEKGSLPPEQALAITEQIASALDYIAQRKLVHRDVKASNIIVDHDGRAVLTDFGLVRALAGSSLTASGAILGTPQYVAPEQLTGGEIGLWTDLYALGVVVYQMLSGSYPFDADPPSALFFQVLWEPPPPVHLVQSTLSPLVDRVLQQAMAKEGQQRFPTGAAFVAALGRALTGEAATAAEVAPPVPEPKARPAGERFASRRQIALVFAMLVLAVGALFLLGQEFFPNSAAPTVSVPAVMARTTQPTASPTPPPTTVPQGPTPATTGPVVPTPGPTTLLTVITATSTITPTAKPTQPATPRSPAPTRPRTSTPTPTLTPAPTFTPAPTSPERPTREPSRPTNTPQPPPTETNTPQPPPTETNTPQPPPTETNTPIPPPPTATNTPVPPPR